MSPSTDEPLPSYGPADQLRHDLKSLLTPIHARAQLLGRAVRRSPSLADEERAPILAGLAEIEAAVREMVALIEVMNGESQDPTDDDRP